MSDAHAEGPMPGRGGEPRPGGSLRFVLPAGMSPVPIEVRRPDMTLARRIHSAETAEDLPEGTYFVTALLPSGENVVAQAQVRTPLDGVPGEETTSVVLAPASTGIPAAPNGAPDDTTTSKGEPDDSDSLVTESPGALSDGATPIPGQESFTALQERALTDLPDSLLESVALESLSLPRQRLAAAPLAVPGSAARTSDEVGPEAPALRLLLYEGNPIIEGDCRPVAPPPFRFSEPDIAGARRCRLAGEPPRFLQARQEGHRPINIALPSYGEISCEIVARLAAGGDGPDEITLDIHLENPRANALLRYLTTNRYVEADALDPDALAAADLLYSKLADPIAAAVGGYTLLALNRMKDGYGEWLGNLCRWFPRLPDGAALHGEFLARNGRHDEALAVFIELEERGLPLISDGLRYASERLSLYARLIRQESQEEGGFGHGMAERVRRLQERLCLFVACADFRQTLLYFRGLTPDRPGNEPAPPATGDPPELRNAELDLTPYFTGPAPV